MAYESVKNQIDTYIKANGVNLITGPILNAVLQAIVNELGGFYQLGGIATPNGTPSVGDKAVVYLAPAGTYPNYGGVTVDTGELALLIWDGEAWSSETVYSGAQSITVDAALDSSSENPVQNKVIVTALSGKQDTISDIATIRSGAALGATAVQPAALNAKQDTISDLPAIRSGAALGSTSVQPADIENMVEALQDIDGSVKKEFWEHPYPTFVRGTLYAGSLAPSIVYRVATDTIMEYDRDITLTADDGFHFGLHKYVDGSFSVDTGWLTKYTVYKGETFKMVIARTVDDTSEVADIDTFVSKVNVTTLVDYIDKISAANIVRNPFAFDHFVYHSNLEKASPYIPSQSLFDIAYAKKLGYEWMEVNPRKCSDGVFVCKHGGSGSTLGLGLTFTDGTLSSSTLFSEVSSATLRQKATYASTAEKYRTHIPTLDEFCAYAKEIGIKLVVQCADSAVVGIVRKYFPDDCFIAYGLSERGDYKGYVYDYTSITSAADALVRSKQFGYPYILSLSNFSDLSEATFKEICAALHQEGNLVAAAYLTSNQMQNALSWGIDVIAVTDTQTPHLKHGNLLSLINDSTGLELTGATFSDGVFELQQGGKINLWKSAYGTKQIQCTLRLVYNGSLNIKTGSSGGSISSLVSDGTKEVVYSALSLYAGTAINIVASSATTISNLQFILEEIAV